MARQRHLRNAPIVEALVDIQVETPVGFDITGVVQSFEAGIGSDYGDRKERRAFEGELRLEGEVAAAAVGVDAYAFRSRSTPQIVQARKNGFTFNRLAPYADWEQLITEAKRTWDVYRETFPIEKTRRIGIRYINAIQPQAPITTAEELKEYLLPEITQPFVTGVDLLDTLRREAYRFKDSGKVAILILALAPFQDRPIPNVIVDIDVNRELEATPAEDALWAEIAEYRDIKNNLFFSSVTDRVANSYE